MLLESIRNTLIMLFNWGRVISISRVVFDVLFNARMQEKASVNMIVFFVLGYVF